MDLEERTSFIKDEIIEKQESQNLRDTSFLRAESRADTLIDQPTGRSERPTELPMKKSKTVSEETISDFGWMINLYFTILTFQLFIPQIIVHSIKDNNSLIHFFNNHKWVFAILVPIIILDVIASYFLKDEIVRKNKMGYCIPFFIIYLITGIIIVTFASFYSDEFTLMFTALCFGSFLIMCICHKIPFTKTKPFIILIGTISYIVIIFVLYACLLKTAVIVFFIFTVFFIAYCTYDIFFMKGIINEFVKNLKVDITKDLTILLYAYSVMYSQVDIFVFLFKK